MDGVTIWRALKHLSYARAFPTKKAPLESGASSTCFVADDRLSCQGQKLLGAIPERDTIPAAATTDWVRPFCLLSH
jgi:hypothetical protein